MFKVNLDKKILLVTVILLVVSCSKENNELNNQIVDNCMITSEKKFNPQTLGEYQVIAHTEISGCNGVNYEFFSYGYYFENQNDSSIATLIESYGLADKNSDTTVILLPNEDYDGIGYLYSATKSGSYKSSNMFEFSKIDEMSFYVNQYEMNWNNYDAIMIKRVIVQYLGNNQWSETILPTKTTESLSLEKVLIAPKSFEFYKNNSSYGSLVSSFLIGGTQTAIGGAILLMPGANVIAGAIGGLIAVGSIIDGVTGVIGALYDFATNDFNASVNNLNSNISYNDISISNESSPPSSYENFSMGQNNLFIADWSVDDGDNVTIFVNGQVVSNNLTLTTSGTVIPINLVSGSNKINILTNSVGTEGNFCSARVDLGGISKTVKGVTGVFTSIYVYAS